MDELDRYQGKAYVYKVPCLLSYVFREGFGWRWELWHDNGFWRERVGTGWEWDKSKAWQEVDEYREKQETPTGG